MSKNKPELTFKYVLADDYNPVYVNGAHGGVSPRGELVMNFYLERMALPRSITHEINPNGTIGNEVAAEPEDLKSSMVRFIAAGVVLNCQSAKELHLWLGERVKEMEALERTKAAMQISQPVSRDVTH
jgi:Zn ribbon nucleic-acid-binding protein